MFKKSVYSLKIALFLSTALLSPLEAVYTMDKSQAYKEQEGDLVRQEELPLKKSISIDFMKSIFSKKATKINPDQKRGTSFGNRCAEEFVGWIENQAETPKQIRPRDGEESMDLFFDAFSKQEGDTKIESKSIRLDCGAAKPVELTFDVVTFVKKAGYQTLEDYLAKIPLKSIPTLSGNFRVGFLYLFDTNPKDKGYLINFYCAENKYFIIDPQWGLFKTLSTFLSRERGKYLKYLYIGYVKDENHSFEVESVVPKTIDKPSKTPKRLRNEGKVPSEKKRKKQKLATSDESMLRNESELRNESDAAIPEIVSEILTTESVIEEPMVVNDSDILSTDPVIEEPLVVNDLDIEEPLVLNNSDIATTESAIEEPHHSAKADVVASESVDESSESKKTLKRLRSEEEEFSRKKSKKQKLITPEVILESEAVNNSDITTIESVIEEPLVENDLDILTTESVEILNNIVNPEEDDSNKLWQSGTDKLKARKEKYQDGYGIDIFDTNILETNVFDEDILELWAAETRRQSEIEASERIISNEMEPINPRISDEEETFETLAPNERETLEPEAVIEPVTSKEISWAEEGIQLFKQTSKDSNIKINGIPIFDLVFSDNESREEKCKILASLIYLQCDWVSDRIQQMVAKETVPSIASQILKLVDEISDPQSAIQRLYFMAAFESNLGLNSIAVSAICTAAILGEAHWAQVLILDLAKCNSAKSQKNALQILMAALNHCHIATTAQWIGQIIHIIAKNEHPIVRDTAVKILHKAIEMKFPWARAQILEMAKSDLDNVRGTAAVVLTLTVMNECLWAKLQVMKMVKENSPYLRDTGEKVLNLCIEIGNPWAIQTMKTMQKEVPVPQRHIISKKTLPNAEREEFIPSQSISSFPSLEIPSGQGDNRWDDGEGINQPIDLTQDSGSLSSNSVRDENGDYNFEKSYAKQDALFVSMTNSDSMRFMGISKSLYVYISSKIDLNLRKGTQSKKTLLVQYCIERAIKKGVDYSYYKQIFDILCPVIDTHIRKKGNIIFDYIRKNIDNLKTNFPEDLVALQKMVSIDAEEFNAKQNRNDSLDSKNKGIVRVRLTRPSPMSLPFSQNQQMIQNPPQIVPEDSTLPPPVSVPLSLPFGQNQHVSQHTPQIVRVRTTPPPPVSVPLQPNASVTHGIAGKTPQIMQKNTVLQAKIYEEKMRRIREIDEALEILRLKKEELMKEEERLKQEEELKRLKRQ